MGKYFGACNIAHPASLPKFENNTQHAVHIAKDVDFIDGDFVRRGGFASVMPMADSHSLHATDAAMYFVRASKFYRVTSLIIPFTEAEIATLASNAALSAARFNGLSYLSNGTDAVILDESTHAVTSWIVATPAAPSAAGGAGSLNAGKYRLAVSQRDSVSGRRSPVSEEITYAIVTGGITLTLPALATGMTHNDVFMSDANGGNLYYQATTVSGSVVLGTFSNIGRQLPSHKQKCLPAGKYLAWFKGRLLSAKDNILTFSDAYWPTMTDAIKGYVPFPNNITAVVPVEAGVWVGTASAQYFLGGTDPAKWEAKTVKDSGVADGSAFYNEEVKLQGWYDNDGVRILKEGGEAESPQVRTFAPRIATSAKLFFDRRTENVVAMLSGTETVSPREHEKYAEFQGV